MRLIIMASAAAALLFSTAAQAGKADRFYVVQDTGTQKCTIVTKKPKAKTTVIVGDRKVYRTKTEAETGMKSIKVCTRA